MHFPFLRIAGLACALVGGVCVRLSAKRSTRSTSLGITGIALILIAGTILVHNQVQ